MGRHTITAIEYPLRLLLMGVVQQSTWAEIDIIINDEAHLEIVLWIRASHFDLIAGVLGLLLHLEYLGKLATTRLKQGRRND